MEGNLADELFVGFDVNAAPEVAPFQLVQQDVLVPQQGNPVLLTAGGISPGGQDATNAWHRWQAGVKIAARVVELLTEVAKIWVRR